MANIPPVKILKASAGSGKTFSLTAHYISLLFGKKIHFSEILAVTFTNKATAEMKHRILNVIEGLALASEEVESYRIIIMKTYPELSRVDLQLKAKEVYRQILHNYSRFAISTIDGFYQKIIRSFSFELGLNAAYRLEMNSDRVKQSLVSRLNKLLNDRDDLLQWIINYARKQIENDRSWNYTTVLKKLADELFKEHFHPFNEAVSKLSEADRQVVFTTMEALSEEIILRFEREMDHLLKKATDIFNRAGVSSDLFLRKSQNLIAKIPSLSSDNLEAVDKFAEYIDNPEKWQKNGLSGAVSDLYNQLNPHLHQLLNYKQEHSRTYFLAKAVQANFYYLRLLKEMSVLLAEYREENAVSLISDAQNLLREINRYQDQNISFIYEKVGNRYKYFLFDEFQDTSANQWQNFKPLLVNALASGGGNQSIPHHLIVGDVKQSIYRWRNGDWRILQYQSGKDLGAHYISFHTLQENYRSLSHIIEFNNFLFTQAPKLLQQIINDKIYNEIGDSLYNSWWQPAGYAQILTDAYQETVQKIPSGRNEGGKVTVSFFPVTSSFAKTRTKEVKPAALKALADTIITWLSNSRYQPHQIGILVRNNTEAREVIEYLLYIQKELEESHKFDVISGDALLLLNNPGIRLLINTLRAMITPAEEASLYRANCLYLYQQVCGQGENDDEVSWLNAAQSDIKIWGKILPNIIINNWYGWQQLPLTELIESLIQGYEITKDEASIPYLITFRDLVAEFSSQGERGITSFLSYWDEEGKMKALPANEGSNAIEIMTIHKSKGLAFDVVMIPFCSWELDGMINSNFWVNTNNTSYEILQSVPVKYNSMLAKSSLFQTYFEEMLFNYMDALNLLYVATTRARKELYISAPDIKEGKGSDSLIADLLRQVLTLHSDELGIEYNKGIIYPSTDTFREVKHPIQPPIRYQEASIDYWESAGNHYWRFNKFPVSDLLKQALDNRKIKRELLSLGEQNTATRQGLLLHELLSLTTEISDFPKHLNRMQSEGLITAEELMKLHEEAVQLRKNEHLAALLDKPYQSLNEQRIITKDGNILRPDKVLIGTDETIILDFKFTGMENSQHIIQVREYQQNLQEMGYPNVRAFLFYAFNNRLVEV
ncbi:UvrD-helicase domain-containing protein [Olivibacter sp. CPCC 100613]|uniref:UvrD-helicase domain-containing protein n=1 Tax=Olivibacter sp. CPCC 100613 TaxID=3079931 RepID=UPI002FF5A019